MCAWRYHGHASPSADSPAAQGICERCNFSWQLSQLQWQYQYRGTGLQNTQFRVCPRCLDVPSAFLKAILLPADPVPVKDPRPGQFQQQMSNSYPALLWDQPYAKWDDGSGSNLPESTWDE